MKQIAADAAAPFGSVYHFFPGGKQELGAETIRTSGRMYMELFASIALEAPDVLTPCTTSLPAPARPCTKPTMPTPVQ